jgi:hypothetical protein
MLRLAKAFFEIALWKKTPAILPASLLLLALAAAGVALTEVLGALLPPPPNDAILLRIVLGVGLPLGFAWAILALARRKQRFLQIGSALLGVGAITDAIRYPLFSVFELLGTNQPAALPIGILLIVGLIWYLLACAHIWSAALDSGKLLGGVISLGYFLLSDELGRQLLPQS